MLAAWSRRATGKRSSVSIEWVTASSCSRVTPTSSLTSPARATPGKTMECWCATSAPFRHPDRSRVERAYAAGVDSRPARHVSVLSAGHVAGIAREQVSYGAAAGPDARPELADIGRLARRLMRRVVTVARAEDGSVQLLLSEHLGADAAVLPVASGSWPAYDQVNVQAGLDAWLAEPGREHQLAGLTQFRHRDFGLTELLQGGGQHFAPGLGGVATEALPAGPGGITRPCVQCGIYLAADADGVAALLVRGPDERAGWSACTRRPRARPVRSGSGDLTDRRSDGIVHQGTAPAGGAVRGRGGRPGLRARRRAAPGDRRAHGRGPRPAP